MKKCKIDGCERLKKSLDLCGMHYARLRKNGDVGSPFPLKKCKDYEKCEVDGCEKHKISCGLCSMHYARLKKHGKVGVSHSKKRPNGMGHISNDGYHYFYKPEHPNAYKNGKVAAHVLVMTEIIGRPLCVGESVHHKNGIKTDNSPDNLELRTSFHPTGQSIKEMVDFCKSYLDKYENYMR
jgi:hypothetical protein